MAAAARPPFDPRLSFEAWRVLGSGLRPSSAGEDEGVPGSWALGDWLVFGRARYGRHYREAAIRASALDPATLRACAAVARRFAPGRRNAALSFAHHAAVVDLGDAAQDAWLAYADVARAVRRDRDDLPRGLGRGDRAHGLRELPDARPDRGLREPRVAE
jgi:hypothetical protein